MERHRFFMLIPIPASLTRRKSQGKKQMNFKSNYSYKNQSSCRLIDFVNSWDEDHPDFFLDQNDVIYDEMTSF